MQNPILGFAPHDIVALATRMRPFLGQLGTTPSTTIPDSHNAGDFGSFLVGAPHRYALDAQALQRHKTDGHLDIDAVRPGAIIVCPVKVDGAGVYLGDMHAMQGDGEIAGHTADVSGTVTLQVEVLKRLGNDGPILFPVAEDLPYLARPLSRAERERALALARRHGIDALEESVPVSVIGTGPDLNSATDNGLARAAELLDMPVPEVMNRATIAGAIEIGRHPGVVQVTLRAPAERLEARGLLGYAVARRGQAAPRRRPRRGALPGQRPARPAAPAAWRLRRGRGRGAADQPGARPRPRAGRDRRRQARRRSGRNAWRVPHLAGAQLVAAPHRRSAPRGTRRAAAAAPARIVAHPRAVDGLDDAGIAPSRQRRTP